MIVHILNFYITYELRNNNIKIIYFNNECIIILNYCQIKIFIKKLSFKKYIWLIESIL